MPLRRMPGGGQPDYIYLAPLGSATAWPGANQGIWIKVRFDKPTAATGILVPNGGTAAGNIKVGMYGTDGTNLTKLALSTGDTAMSGTSVGQSISFASPLLVSPFQDYYAFMASDSGTATFSRLITAAAPWTLPSRLAYLTTSVYATPPTSQAIAGLSGTSYIPSLAIITTG